MNWKKISLVRWSFVALAKLGLSGKGLVIAVPTLWLLIFFLIPFVFIAKISFSEAVIQQPPYLPLTIFNEEGVLQISLNFSNYQYLLEDTLYFLSYLASLRIAFFSTIFCLLIGYPLAYYIARSSEVKRNFLLLLIVLPFWTSFLLRVYAWIGILKPKGYFNAALLALGIISEPLTILRTDIAVYIGIVYTYLPFMILPLYANLVKLDNSLLEASTDLGANSIVTFLKITLPLSLPGILAGSALVLIPAIGEFVIPSLLGGADNLMIGKVIWSEFFSNRDWPVASAVSIAMLILIVIPIMFLRNLTGTENKT